MEYLKREPNSNGPGGLRLPGQSTPESLPREDLATFVHPADPWACVYLKNAHNERVLN
jgi:hypothetical protein